MMPVLKRPPIQVLAPVVVALGVILFVLTQSCGCGSSQQRQLKVTLTAVDTARVAFATWDEVEQDKIVAAAKTFEEGHKALIKHREKRDRLIAAFEATYRLIALAAAEPDDDKIVLAVASAAALWEAYRQVIGHEPPTKSGETVDAGVSDAGV